MAAQTESRTSRTSHDFNPVVHHRVLRRDIAWSIATGGTITALCGMSFAVSADKTGTESNGTLTFCPLCETALTYLSKGGGS